MKHIVLFAFAVCILLTGGIAAPAWAADDENCILCHKYRTLSRIDEQGQSRLYYVNAELFHGSAHGKIRCKECHTGISKIPHEEDTEVNCLNECHIIEPTSEKRFSHKPVEKLMMESIHNPDQAFVTDRTPEDFPKCVDCHINPLFRPVSMFKNVTDEGQSPKSLARCNLCHEEMAFIKYFYNHVTHRLHNSKRSEELVEMCSKCHTRPEMEERHKLTNAVATYKDTFHGKAVEFDMPNAPDCIDCHVNSSESAHAIRSHRDPRSSVHESRRWKTCANRNCHPNSTEGMGEVRMHVAIDKDQYPVEFYTALGFTTLTLGVYYPLMLLLIMELLREMFPNFAFIREKRSTPSRKR